MLHILRICVVVIMYRNCLAIMICPDTEHVLNGTKSFWCNGTDAHWMKDGEQVVNGIIHSNTSVELQIIYNSSEPNVTYTCCVARNQSHDCNETYMFAFGPTDLHLDSSHSDTPFYLCPDSQDVITVTCDAIGVRPEQAKVKINLASTNSCWTSNDSTCTFRPKHGGNVTVSCTASNTICPNVTETKTISISVYEPPVLKINNLDHANNTKGLISLSSAGNQTISCSIFGGFPLLHNVSVSCEGAFERRLVENGTEVTIPRIGCSTLCHCWADHVTGCNQSVTRARLVITENLYFVDNQTAANFKLKRNSMFSQTLHIGGCPLPNQFNLSAQGVPANQIKVSITCEVHVGSKNFSCDDFLSSVTEATVRLSIGPVNENYFTNYTLVVKNDIGQDLMYKFVLVKDSEDNLNLPLIIALSASLGGALLLTIAIASVAAAISKRRRKSQHTEASPEVQATPKTKVYRLATSDHSLDHADHAAECPNAADSESGQSVSSTPIHATRRTHSSEIIDNDGREIYTADLLSDVTIDDSKPPLKTMYAPQSLPGVTMSTSQHFSADIMDALRLLTAETWGATQLLSAETAASVSSTGIPSVVVTDATPPLPAKVGKRKNLQASKSVYDIPPSQDRRPTSNCDSENSESEVTVNGFEPSFSDPQNQPVAVDKDEPPVSSEPPALHGARSKAKVTITSDLGGLSSANKSGYENVVISW